MSSVSVFLIELASSIFLPLTHSVIKELEAIADPQPNVLNLASSITPSSLTLICNFITSPHAGAPTKPVTFSDDLSSDPTFLGFRSDLKVLCYMPYFLLY